LKREKYHLLRKEEAVRRLYGGNDLHSTNSVLALLDEKGKVVYRRRLPNELPILLRELEPYRAELEGIAVESTFNWYWFVDGLMDAGYRLHLANPAAMQQYTGLKHADDDTDAVWLGEMLRLGILPEGYIYPKAERSLRDLLRKRGQLVRYRTANLLSIQNQWQRSTGQRLSGNDAKVLTPEQIEARITDPDRALALEANLAVVRCLNEQLEPLERRVLEQATLKPAFRPLQTVAGIGKILGLTVMLETGSLGRFGSVGDYASYCRCVPSQRLSNGKRKGRGNVKNGNRYLAWAFGEAAHFAIRYYPAIRRFYQRKQARTNRTVAMKTVAHKLARATYYVLRDQVSFDLGKAFG
jgi:transposase